jgi:hypothetical protein
VPSAPAGRNNPSKQLLTAAQLEAQQAQEHAVLLEQHTAAAHSTVAAKVQGLACLRADLEATSATAADYLALQHAAQVLEREAAAATEQLDNFKQLLAATQLEAHRRRAAFEQLLQAPNSQQQQQQHGAIPFSSIQAAALQQQQLMQPQGSCCTVLHISHRHEEIRHSRLFVPIQPLADSDMVSSVPAFDQARLNLFPLVPLPPCDSAAGHGATTAAAAWPASKPVKVLARFGLITASQIDDDTAATADGSRLHPGQEPSTASAGDAVIDAKHQGACTLPKQFAAAAAATGVGAAVGAGAGAIKASSGRRLPAGDDLAAAPSLDQLLNQQQQQLAAQHSADDTIGALHCRVRHSVAPNPVGPTGLYMTGSGRISEHGQSSSRWRSAGPWARRSTSVGSEKPVAFFIRNSSWGGSTAAAAAAGSMTGGGDGEVVSTGKAGSAAGSMTGVGCRAVTPFAAAATGEQWSSHPARVSYIESSRNKSSSSSNRARVTSTGSKGQAVTATPKNTATVEGRRKATGSAAAAPKAPMPFLRKNSYRLPSAAISLKVTASTAASSKPTAPTPPVHNLKGGLGGIKQPACTGRASSSTTGAKLAGGSSQAGGAAGGINRKQSQATGITPRSSSSSIHLRRTGPGSTTGPVASTGAVESLTPCVAAAGLSSSSIGGSSRFSSAGGFRKPVLRYSTADSSSGTSRAADVPAVLAGQPGGRTNRSLSRARRQPGDLAPEIARLQALHAAVLAEFEVLKASMGRGHPGTK